MVEQLEPRYLLSADLMPFVVDMSGVDGAAYSLKYDNLLQSVMVYDDNTGQLMNQRLIQQIDYIQVTGTGSDDTLTIDFSEDFLRPVDIAFAGGGGNNTLSLQGGDFDMVNLGVDGSRSGQVSVSLGGATQAIDFTGVSNVVDTTTAREKIFADLTGGGQTLRMSDAGTAGDGMSLIDSAGTGALVAYTFLDPNVKLTVDAGDGDDTFLHNGFDDLLSGKVLLSGGSGTDAVTGPPGNTDWNITGSNSGDVSGVSFVEVENLIGSADNEDTFFVSEGGSLSGVLDGGDDGFDSLVFDGNSSTLVYKARDAHSGTITRDGVVLTYAGLEPITNTGTAAAMVFDLTESSDSATLTQSGNQLTLAADGIPTFESTSFAAPTESLTINLGDDQGVFPLLNEYLDQTDAALGLINFVQGDAITFQGAIDLGSAGLTVDGQGGLDNIVVAGSLTAGAIHFKSEEINVEAGASVTGTSVNFDAAAEGNGLIPTELTEGLYLAAPHATINIEGDVSATAGDVVMSATATSSLSPTPGQVSSLSGALVLGLPKATITLGTDGDVASGAGISATGAVDLDTAVNVTVAAEDAADSNDTEAKVDAAVAVTTLISKSEVGIYGASTIDAAGAVSADAASTFGIENVADGTQGGAGATVAATVVVADTGVKLSDVASIGANAEPTSVALAATTTSTIKTSAISTKGGGDESADGTNESEQQLADNNAGTAEGSVNFAGAVAVTVYKPVTEISSDTSGSITSSGDVTLTATTADTITSSADGSNTGSGGSGVGVAVAIGVITPETRVSLGGSGSYTTPNVILTATLEADSTYKSEATSGVGDGAKTGLAGALAIDTVITTTEALVESGANISLNGANLTLTANSATATEAAAKAEVDGSGNATGIGASVAIGVGDNDTLARISGAVVGAANVTVSASGAHDVLSSAEGGAAGGTAVTPVVATAVALNDTTADILAGTPLAVAGDLTVTAEHDNEAASVATGAVKGTNAAVGASLALTIAKDSLLADLARSVTALPRAASAAAREPAATSRASALPARSPSAYSARRRRTTRTR